MTYHSVHPHACGDNCCYVHVGAGASGSTPTHVGTMYSTFLIMPPSVSDTVGVGHCLTAMSNGIPKPLPLLRSALTFALRSVHVSKDSSCCHLAGVGHNPPSFAEMRCSHITCGYNFPLATIPSDGQF